MRQNTYERWGSVSIGLHWTIAALVLLVQVPAGLTMVAVEPGYGAERPLQHPQDQRHGDLPARDRPARLALRIRCRPAGGPAGLAGEARADHPRAPLPAAVPDADHRLSLHRDGRLSGAVLICTTSRAWCRRTSRWRSCSSTHTSRCSSCSTPRSSCTSRARCSTTSCAMDGVLRRCSRRRRRSRKCAASPGQSPGARLRWTRPG